MAIFNSYVKLPDGIWKNKKCSKPPTSDLDVGNPKYVEIQATPMTIQ